MNPSSTEQGSANPVGAYAKLVLQRRYAYKLVKTLGISKYSKVTLRTILMQIRERVLTTLGL